MKLFWSPASPFVRKVDVFLHLAGQSDAVERVSSGGTPMDPSNMPAAENPLAKLPTLVTEAGDALFDSRVICRYLDTRFAIGLYPEGDALWRVLTTEALADGVLDAAVLMVYESRLRDETIRFAPFVEGQWGKITRALDRLNADGARLVSGPVNAAQIATGCALGYLDFRHSDRDWREGRPDLAAFAEAFNARDEMQKTQPVG